jgi:hypothetical protein
MDDGALVTISSHNGPSYIPKLTIFELDSDSLIRTFHQKSTKIKRVSQKLRAGPLGTRAQLVPRRASLRKIAYLTSFIMTTCEIEAPRLDLREARGLRGGG